MRILLFSVTSVHNIFASVNIECVRLEMHVIKYAGVLWKVSRFNENENVSTTFIKAPHYQI
jgi:hypothetical protein